VSPNQAVLKHSEIRTAWKRGSTLQSSVTERKGALFLGTCGACAVAREERGKVLPHVRH